MGVRVISDASHGRLPLPELLQITQAAASPVRLEYFRDQYKYEEAYALLSRKKFPLFALYPELIDLHLKTLACALGLHFSRKPPTSPLRLQAESTPYGRMVARPRLYLNGRRITNEPEKGSVWLTVANTLRSLCRTYSGVSPCLVLSELPDGFLCLHDLEPDYLAGKDTARLFTKGEEANHLVHHGKVRLREETQNDAHLQSVMWTMELSDPSPLPSDLLWRYPSDFCGMRVTGAYIGRHLVGYAGTINNGSILQNIRVLPLYRNRGIAGTLLAALPSLQKLQCRTELVTFYEKYGFCLTRKCKRGLFHTMEKK